MLRYDAKPNFLKGDQPVILLTIYQIIDILANVLIMLIIVQFVIGLLLAFNVINTSNRFVVSVYESINTLLDPVLRPIRRVLPTTGSIDFSPLVLIIGLQIILIVLENIIRSTVA